MSNKTFSLVLGKSEQNALIEATVWAFAGLRKSAGLLLDPFGGSMNSILNIKTGEDKEIANRLSEGLECIAGFQSILLPTIESQSTWGGLQCLPMPSGEKNLLCCDFFINKLEYTIELIFDYSVGRISGSELKNAELVLIEMELRGDARCCYDESGPREDVFDAEAREIAGQMELKMREIGFFLQQILKLIEISKAHSQEGLK